MELFSMQANVKLCVALRILVVVLVSMVVEVSTKVSGQSINTLQAVRCALSLSDASFGGVAQACGGGAPPDKEKCCPVLAAWIYAADARLALAHTPSPSGPIPGPQKVPGSIADVTPDCVSSIESALETHDLEIETGNATCDPIVCYCGIHIFEMDDASCPFEGIRSLTPSVARKSVEDNCKLSNHDGCTSCVDALENSQDSAPQMTTSASLNGTRQYCKLLGLMWLLYSNRSLYIPTVSAVVRATMFHSNSSGTPQCSLDKAQMPLAYDFLSVRIVNSGYLLHSIPRMALLALCMTVLLIINSSD